MLNFIVSKILKWLGVGKTTRKQVSNLLNCMIAIIDMGSDILVCGFWIKEGEPFWGVILGILIVAGNIIAQKVFNSIVKGSPFDTKEMRYAFLLDLGVVIFTYQNWDYLSMPIAATAKKHFKKNKEKKKMKEMKEKQKKERKKKHEKNNNSNTKNKQSNQNQTHNNDKDTNTDEMIDEDTGDLNDEEVEQLQFASLAQILQSMAKLNEILLESMLCGAFQLYSVVTSNSYNDLLIASLLLSLLRISNGVEKNLSNAQKQQSIATKMIDKMIYRKRKSSLRGDTKKKNIQKQLAITLASASAGYESSDNESTESHVSSKSPSNKPISFINNSSNSSSSKSERKYKENSLTMDNKTVQIPTISPHRTHIHTPRGHKSTLTDVAQLFTMTLEDFQHIMDSDNEHNERLTLNQLNLSSPTSVISKSGAHAYTNVVSNDMSPRSPTAEPIDVHARMNTIEIITENGKLDLDDGAYGTFGDETMTTNNIDDAHNPDSSNNTNNTNDDTDVKNAKLRQKFQDVELNNIQVVFNRRRKSIEVIEHFDNGNESQTDLNADTTCTSIDQSQRGQHSTADSRQLHPKRRGSTVVNYEFKPKYYELYEIASKVFIGADVVVRVLSKSLYAGIFVPAWPYAAISVLLIVLTTYYGYMSFKYQHEHEQKIKWYNLVVASVVANVSFLGETPGFLQTALSKLIVSTKKRLFFTYFLSFLLFIGWIVASLTIDTLQGYCMETISSPIETRTFYRNCQLCYQAMGQPLCVDYDSEYFNETDNTCIKQYNFSNTDRQECAWNLALDDRKDIECGVDSSLTNCYIINPMQEKTAYRWILVFGLAFVIVIASMFVIIWADKELLIMQKINIDVKIQLKNANQKLRTSVIKYATDLDGDNDNINLKQNNHETSTDKVEPESKNNGQQIDSNKAVDTSVMADRVP